MDNLSKEQLLLLQQNLTYEQYEHFMSMFNDKDEELPKKKEIKVKKRKRRTYKSTLNI